MSLEQHTFDPGDMSVIGARELRRSASEILKEVEIVHE